MVESRAVWKDLGSRRIGKSLEESRDGDRVRSDVKGHGFLMVYTWCAHVQRRLRYDVKAHVGSIVALWKTHVDE